MSVRSYPFIVAIASFVLGAGCIAGAGDGDDSTSNGAEAEQAAQATEASAYGCHEDECIDVIGAGRYVNYVKSEFINNYDKAICSRHHLTVRTSTGSLWLSSYGPQTCVQPDDYSYHYWWERRDFPNHSRVCVTFAGETACETVHS